MEPINNDSDDSNVPNIEIDWEQYFQDFCEKHGKYPIMYKGTYLFPDGWRYSSTDFAGPEWQPPMDEKELAELKLYYYNRRYNIIEQELAATQITLENITNLQRVKDVPLKQRILVHDEESGLVRSEVRTIDTLMIEKRIKWLVEDKNECWRMIDKLRNTIRNHRYIDS